VHRDRATVIQTPSRQAAFRGGGIPSPSDQCSRRRRSGVGVPQALHHLFLGLTHPDISGTEGGSCRENVVSFIRTVYPVLGEVRSIDGCTSRPLGEFSNRYDGDCFKSSSFLRCSSVCSVARLAVSIRRHGLVCLSCGAVNPRGP